MEITQRTGLDVNYWKGHYSGTAHFLTFDIYMKGKKSFFSDKSKESYETWYITYTVEGDSMTVSSNDIPAPGTIIYVNNKPLNIPAIYPTALYIQLLNNISAIQTTSTLPM